MSNTTSQLSVKLSLQGAEQVRSGIKQVEGSVGSLTTVAEAATAALGPMLGTLTAGATLGKLVSVQREFDVLNSSLKTVTGSSAAAAKEMEWIKAFAKETPFGLAQATQAFIKMKSLGLDPSRAALTSYGNTASAMGKDLNQMIEAVADASTGEFERLKEFGIKASKEGDRVKLTFQGVSQTIGNNASEINAYLQSIGDNQFAGAMADRAATLDGAIASLGDTWDELFRTISAQGVGTLMHDSVRLAEGAVTDLTTIIQALNGATSDNAQQTGAMAVVQDGLATAFEAVAVLGVNVKYTLAQVGNELGGLAAQAAAVATGQFAQAAEIGRLMRSDAVAARAEVDATSARILNARKVAALGLPNNYDEPAVIRARAAALAIETDAKKAAAAAAAKQAAAETAAAAAAKQAASDAKKELAQFNTALESVREKASGLSSTYTETLSALYNGYQKNRIGADDYRTAVEALIQQQPFFVEAEKAKAASIAEAEKLLATARAGTLKISEASEEAQATSADQLAERLASMRDEIDLIGLTTSQVADLTAAKAQQVIADKEIELIMLSNADASAAQIASLEREINLRRQLVGAMREKTVKEAAAESADLAQKEWKKAAEQIEQSLTDALTRGFESGKGFAENMRDTVENMLKTLVLRPIVSAVVSPMAGAITAGLGLPGAASAATTGTSALSGLGGLGTLGGSLGALGTGLGAGAGMIAGGGIGGWLTASTSLIGTGTAAGAMAGIGALAGPIGAALAVASLLKGLDDSGTMHTGGIGGYSAAGGTATGAAAGLRFGVDAKDYTASAATASAQIAQSIVGMLDSTAATFGQQAGYYAATAFADDTSKDGAWGALMLKLGDKLVLDWANNPERDANVPRVFANGEAGAKEYAAAVAKDVRDYLITQTPAWADTMLTALGDAPSLEQLAATVGQINATATALEGMGRASQAFANLAESATNTLITALGGGEAAVANLGSYYTNYYSQADRAEISTRQLTEQLATLGVALPETRDAYRDLVDNALASGNQQLAADLIKLSGAYATVSQSADDLARETIARQQEASRQAVEAQRAAESAAKAIADQRLGLEEQLLQLQGNTVDLRRRELAALDPSNQSLQQHIWLLQDQQTALEQQQEAERQALAAQQAITDQRLGLENQLLQLQGDTVELRRRELAALAPSNQSLQQNIWLLQDQQAALQSFTSAFDGVASAFSSLASAESSLADIDLQARIDAANAANEAAKAMGDAAQNLRDYVRGQTTTPQEQFADVLRRAMQGDATAMQALPGSATAANDAALAAASSATEYAIARAKTLVAVDQAANFAASKSGLIDVPQKVAESPTVAALRDIETAVKAMSNAVTSAISIDLANNLGKIDLNKNSAIEFAELKSAFGGMASEATLAKVFATLDVDGNGQITLLEAISRNTDGTKLAISGLGSIIQQLQAGGLSSAAAAQQIADLTKISGTTASGQPASSNATTAVNTPGGTQNVHISSSGAVSVGDTIYGTSGNSISVQQAISNINKAIASGDLYSIYYAALADGVSAASLDAMMGWTPGASNTWARSVGLPAFANGGVFTNGIVTRPTAFDIGLMGEAGDEAIMPLSRMPNGRLGVATYSGGRDSNAAVVAELRELRTELQSLRAETRATAINTGRTEQLMKRVTRNGEAMQTVVTA